MLEIKEDVAIIRIRIPFIMGGHDVGLSIGTDQHCSIVHIQRTWWDFVIVIRRRIISIERDYTVAIRPKIGRSVICLALTRFIGKECRIIDDFLLASHSSHIKAAAFTSQAINSRGLSLIACQRLFGNLKGDGLAAIGQNFLLRLVLVVAAGQHRSCRDCPKCQSFHRGLCVKWFK